MNTPKDEILQRARRCLEIEIDAIRATAAELGDEFASLVSTVHETIEAGKKLIFTGVGKNAHISSKLAGTFNSTGVSACVLDPNQALHGDLGLCAEGDLVFVLSNSGATEEILKLIPLIKRLGALTVAITADRNSVLAKESDCLLAYSVAQEACPLNLAPTASTTAVMALGDALAMVLLEERGFSRDDFALYHPAGSLGKSLLLHAGEIMRTGNRFACLPHTCSVREAIQATTDAHCGTIALSDPETGRLSGVFSDGDLRRHLLNIPNLLDSPVERYMTRNPKTVETDELGAEVLYAFEHLKVNDLIVVDKNGKPLGIIDGQDLPKLRII